MPESRKSARKSTGKAATSARARRGRKPSGPNADWFVHDRFGMFIHWGLYALPARHEWVKNRERISDEDYQKYFDHFYPDLYDPTEWARMAREAGMKYFVVTTKHHDGFCLWPTALNDDWNISITPHGKDLLEPLADACREEGLRLGFYYSQTQDWHERDAVGNDWDFPAEGRDFPRYLRTKAIPQIEELLRGYGPVAGVWFDTPGPITPDQSRMLVDLVHERQPQCLVNSRIGNGLGDYDTLGDQEVPRLPPPGLWETPDTHNDTWAYSRYDTNWKSAREIAERLLRGASRGGNYLHNVGPDGKGRIPEQSARILREVGRWVRQHERAIHGAGPTPLGPQAWG